MIFLNSGSAAAALVFYPPGVCTHTETEGKQRKSPEYFKIFEKNTIFNEHPADVRKNVYALLRGLKCVNAFLGLSTGFLAGLRRTGS